jgi:hypothetical protein
MRYFAAQGLLGDLTDVWDAGLNDTLSEGFKIASTGDDGLQYFVPWTYYIWGIYYRPSLFEENGWTPPTSMEDLQALASNMQDAGIVPFAFGNDGRWPAMGTFDQLNFRLNGYQFHVDLMAGKESWTDERVRNVSRRGRASCRSTREPQRPDWRGGGRLREQRSRDDDHRHFVGEVFPNGGPPTSTSSLPDEPGVRHRHGRGADRRLDDGATRPTRAARSALPLRDRPGRRRRSCPNPAWRGARMSTARSTTRCRL